MTAIYLVVVYMSVCALCYLTPYSHLSRNYVLANHEMFIENFYPAHQFLRDGNYVYAKGNFTIDTTNYKEVFNTNKYSLINLCESSKAPQTNIVDMLPANALPIPINGVTSLPVENLGGMPGLGPPSNTQLKEIAAKIPEEIFAVWINLDCNLYIIDNRDKDTPKLFTPYYYNGRVFESEKRKKTLGRAILIANIKDYLIAPFTTGRALIFSFLLRGING